MSIDNYKKVDILDTVGYTVIEVISMSRLGEAIRNARQKIGMTQEELAVELNTTKSTISKYELGKRKPHIDQLSKIAKATKTTVSELVEEGYWANVPKYEIEASFSDNPNRVILCGLFDQLSELGQQKAVEYLEVLIIKYRAE